MIVKVVVPAVKAMVPAEGVASKESPLILSRTKSEPFIWVSEFISKNGVVLVTASTAEELLGFWATISGGGDSLGLVKYEAVIQEVRKIVTRAKTAELIRKRVEKACLPVGRDFLTVSLTMSFRAVSLSSSSSSGKTCKVSPCEANSAFFSNSSVLTPIKSGLIDCI